MGTPSYFRAGPLDSPDFLGFRSESLELGVDPSLKTSHDRAYDFQALRVWHRV